MAIGRNIGFKLSGNSNRPEYVGFLKEMSRTTNSFPLENLHRDEESAGGIQFDFSTVEGKSEQISIGFRCSIVENFLTVGDARLSPF